MDNNKVFDFVDKKYSIGQINHRFIKEDSLEKAIQKHDVDMQKYDVVEMTLDEFITINDRLDKHFGYKEESSEKRKALYGNYHGVLIVTNVIDF